MDIIIILISLLFGAFASFIFFNAKLARLNEKNIVFKKNVIILDGVHSGTGINALQSALLYYNHNLNIHKY